MYCTTTRSSFRKTGGIAAHLVGNKLPAAKLRDHPGCAQQEFDQLLDTEDPGLHAQLTFSLDEPVLTPALLSQRPTVAILREQGVNGQVEMAAAFDRAGFNAVDVHMSDILSGRVKLAEFKGLVAGGGFSYGDVLGAGRGGHNPFCSILGREMNLLLSLHVPILLR